MLPKKKEGINFYELSFEGFEERIYVYPDICLQTKLPKIIECCNQTDITNQFLEDLKVKVPQICGKELSFVYQNVRPIENFLKPMEVIYKNSYFSFKLIFTAKIIPYLFSRYKLRKELMTLLRSHRCLEIQVLLIAAA